jgi:hypothetical protein
MLMEDTDGQNIPADEHGEQSAGRFTGAEKVRHDNYRGEPRARKPAF